VSDYVVGEKGLGVSVGTVGLESVEFASLALLDKLLVVEVYRRDKQECPYKAKP
jgi:hypothetical protein